MSIEFDQLEVDLLLQSLILLLRRADVMLERYYEHFRSGLFCVCKVVSINFICYTFLFIHASELCSKTHYFPTFPRSKHLIRQFNWWIG